MRHLRLGTLLTTVLLISTGCGKKTVTSTSGDATSETSPTEEAGPVEEDTPAGASAPTELAVDECSCRFAFPAPPNVKSPELQSCVESAYADQGVAIPDADTPVWEWSPNPDAESGKVTVKLPRIFDDEADMERYAAANQACMMELVTASTALGQRAWTEAPCAAQCSGEESRVRPLCTAICTQATAPAD